MRRYLFETPWFSVRLHHILKSDEDRGWHDHPWDFLSILLTNGYTEHRPDIAYGGFLYNMRAYIPQFTLVSRWAEDRHRLELTDGPVWTLVFTGPRRREWGFIDSRGQWTHYSKHKGAVN